MARTRLGFLVAVPKAVGSMHKLSDGFAISCLRTGEIGRHLGGIRWTGTPSVRQRTTKRVHKPNERRFRTELDRYLNGCFD